MTYRSLSRALKIHVNYAKEYVKFMVVLFGRYLLCILLRLSQNVISVPSATKLNNTGLGTCNISVIRCSEATGGSSAQSSRE